MKIVLVVSFITLSCFAEYQQGKIDMHGGKDTYKYDKKKSNFVPKNMGIVLFLDKNSSKKSVEK